MLQCYIYRRRRRGEECKHLRGLRLQGLLQVIEPARRRVTSDLSLPRFLILDIPEVSDATRSDPSHHPPDDRATVAVEGVSGPSCEALTEDLERALGVVCEKRRTSEYYQVSSTAELTIRKAPGKQRPATRANIDG